jgi:hypothetical protein
MIRDDDCCDGSDDDASGCCAGSAQRDNQTATESCEMFGG